MPVIYKIKQQSGQRTAIWQIAENEHVLTKAASLSKADYDAFSLLTNPGRRLEWLVVRILLKEFYLSPPAISYVENGRPFLLNCNDRISISHSGNIVSITLYPDKTPGIDVEVLHPRIFKIAQRFLNEPEKAYLGTDPSIEQLTIIWGAKEVMFKVYELGGISFKTDFEVKPFTLAPQGRLEGFIYKEDRPICIPMEYMKMNDFVMVQTNYFNS